MSSAVCKQEKRSPRIRLRVAKSLRTISGSNKGFLQELFAWLQRLAAFPTQKA